MFIYIPVAEIDRPEDIAMLMATRPDRIGHATFLNHKHKHGHSIPFEICLTSNMICATTPSLHSHHFVDLWRQRHPLILCTDDKGLICGVFIYIYIGIVL